MSAQTQPPDPNPTWLTETNRRVGRYILGPSLGQGGMGEVFRAWDSLLGRQVALKMLTSWSAEATLMLLKEARLQARVDHPNVCRVLDVDVDGDLPYIAMQLVDGPTLKEAGLDVREAAAAIQTVSEAIHAAHRINLIHRDLKPTNILLERNERGGWTPVVCDFGLAKDLASELNSRSLASAGTPAFMAPEQQYLHRATIGPRSDIFALGATLFDLLIGHPPGPGLNEVGRPVFQKLNPAIPKPLERIIQRCLEWDPADRYPTAAALAEDLRRFLDDEPLQPRNEGIGPYIRWQFKRHPRASSFLVAGLLSTIGIAAAGIWSKRELARQATAAELFVGTVKDLQYQMKLERMLPAHDLRPGFALIRSRMAGLEDSMYKLGAPARGPGSFALGWGHLLLHEPEEALRRFETAWASGYRTPDAATAWAKAHCDAFIDALPATRQSGQGAVDRLKELHLKPAQSLLPSGTGARLISVRLVEIQLKNLLGDPQGAIDLARQEARGPDEYEVLLLEADALTSLGFTHQLAGQYAKADVYYQEADGLLHRSQEIARSDELGIKLELNRRLAWIVMKSEASGESPKDFEQIEALADRLLALTAEWLPAIADKLTVLWRRSEFNLARGANPEPDLLRGIEILRQSETLPHARSRLQRERAGLCRVLAQWKYECGEDPRPIIEMGLSGSLMDEFAADLLVLRARWELDQRGDPSPDLLMAKKAVDSPTFLAMGEYGLARRQLEIAYLETVFATHQGQDPDEPMSRALHASKVGLAANPNSSDLLMKSADCWNLAFLIKTAKGEPNTEMIRKGLKDARKAYALRPYGPTARCLARLLIQMAEHKAATSSSPSQYLRESRQYIDEAKRLQPKHHHLLELTSRLDRLIRNSSPD